MSRPTLKKHQSWHEQEANESRFEFFSPKHQVGGLLTLTDFANYLQVDVWRVDKPVKVRVHKEG